MYIFVLPAFLGFVLRQQGIFQRPHLVRNIQKIPKCFFCNSGAVFPCVIDCDDLGEHKGSFCPAAVGATSWAVFKADPLAHA